MSRANSSNVCRSAPTHEAQQFLIEPAGKTPVAEKTDVVICGGGPAGVAAALAAARAQKQLGRKPSVRLLEVHGQLGGVWTTGMLSLILDAGNKGGIMDELLTHSDAQREARGASIDSRESGYGLTYDIEQMKLLLEQACVADGVRVRLHTRIVAAQCDKFGRLTHVITESKSGREAFAAECFIDCTGDGDLAALAGCQYDFGRPQDPHNPASDVAMQPMTLMCLLTGLNSAQIIPFHRGPSVSPMDAKNALYNELIRAGYASSYTHPTLFKIYDDLFAVMMNHEYGWNPHDAQQITDATIAARREVNQLVDALRSLGGCWKNLRLVATAGQIGVRESRRPYGLYRVTLDDLVNGQRHDDAVCECTFGIDVHATSRQRGNGAIEKKPVARTLPYDIPYRALVSRDVDGLMFAGRCISGDFFAHASYRVTGNAVAMGEAAGCAAAVAAANHLSPKNIDFNRDVRVMLDLLPLQHAAT